MVDGYSTEIYVTILDSVSCVSYFVVVATMTLLKKMYITIVVIINANFIHASMMDENSVIDLNDILSEKLMPASLFFMNNPVVDVVSEFRTLDNETTTHSTNYDGTFTNSFTNAYSTMGFHR